MAEGRMLKKVICNSKKLGSLSSDSARLLYTWLIPWLDIKGRYLADPDIIKGHLFPKVKTMTPEKIRKYLFELHEKELIKLYSANGEEYLSLLNFENYQVLRENREADSKIPEPPKETTPGVLLESSCTTQAQVKLSKDKLSKYKEGQKGLSEIEEERWIKKEFEKFYKAYPRKIHKERAFSKYKSIRKKHTETTIISALNGYIDFLKYKKEVENFEQAIKHPEFFLTESFFKEFIGYKFKARL